MGKGFSEWVSLAHEPSMSWTSPTKTRWEEAIYLEIKNDDKNLATITGLNQILRTPN